VQRRARAAAAAAACRARGGRRPASGRDHPGAPGLGTRLPQPVRDRLATALRTATAFDDLGEEQVDASHFTLDPALARTRWYRATPAGYRYVTLRLSITAALFDVLVENQ
jgi:hypothetical protein